MARKTKAEAEATREDILTAAEHVFLERGVARATLANIATAAGVTRGAIYWHFRNKTDLFDTMLERVQMPMIDLVLRLPDEPENRPLAALHYVCSLGLSKLVTDPQYKRVHTILHHRCEPVPELQPSLQRHADVIQKVLSSMESYFRRPANREALRPDLTPRMAARIVHVYLYGLHQDWLRNPSAFDLGRDSQVMLETVLRGLLRDPDQAPSGAAPLP